MNALTVTKLHKTYRNDVKALKGIDLTIEEGDFFGLIGANGAGKSTLIGIITGMVKKTAGSVKIFGVDIDQEPEHARTFIGIVPQEFNFSIFEKNINILIHQAGYYGIPKAVAKDRAEEVLTLLGLWEKRFSEPRTLSGGMKRRLMLARALMHRPRFLLLDEPTAGIDITTRQSTWEYLRKLNEQGITILLTSHNLDEIEILCSHAAIIHKGNILANDSVHNLVHSLDRQVYVVRFDSKEGWENIRQYSITPLHDNSFEVVIENGDDLSLFISELKNAGLALKDLRPKYNRLEQIYFNYHAEFEDVT